MLAPHERRRAADAPAAAGRRSSDVARRLLDPGGPPPAADDEQAREQQRRARAGAPQHRRKRQRLPRPVRQPDQPRLVGDGNRGGRPVGAGGRERPLRLAAHERAGDGAELAVPVDVWIRRPSDSASAAAGPGPQLLQQRAIERPAEQHVKVIPMRASRWLPIAIR